MPDKPVAERLQVKGGRRLAVVGAPPGLDRAVGAFEARAAVASADVVVLVAPGRARLEAELPTVLATARPAAILRVAYPGCPQAVAA